MTNMTVEGVERALVVFLGIMAAWSLILLTIDQHKTLSYGDRIARLGAIGTCLCISWGSIATALGLDPVWRLTPMVVSLAYVLYGRAVQRRDWRGRKRG